MSARRRSARGRGRSGIGILIALLVVLGGALYTHGRGSSTAARSSSAATSPSASAADPGHVPAGTLDAAPAGTALGTLAVAPKASLSGYDRGCGQGAGCVFGPAWADVDHNGCDTRNDVLHRDLTAVEVRAGTHDCVVVAGTLADPYTATTVAFAKAHADQVQIDHVVPLAAAWTQGAASWTADRRKAFANDSGNLIATTSGPNESKGDDTADEWVPPNTGYGCSYARVVVTVKARYVLSVTAGEAAALRNLLATC